MHLISLYIENFGKLSGFAMDFNPGYNEVYQENGWGKTTLCTFIFAMFYGLGNSRKKDVSENMRLHYKPWQGGTYGGRLSFEVKGKQYEIVRTFGSKESEDTFELRDKKNGLISGDYLEKVGEKLFGMDRESFAGTVWMTSEMPEVIFRDDVHAKIENLTEELWDIRDFDSALKILEAKARRLTPDRITGSLKKREGEIYSLKERNRELEDIIKREPEINEQRRNLKAQSDAVEEEYRNLVADTRICENSDYERKTKLEEQLSEKKRCLSDLTGAVASADNNRTKHDILKVVLICILAIAVIGLFVVRESELYGTYVTIGVTLLLIGLFVLGIASYRNKKAESFTEASALSEIGSVERDIKRLEEELRTLCDKSTGDRIAAAGKLEEKRKDLQYQYDILHDSERALAEACDELDNNLSLIEESEKIQQQEKQQYDYISLAAEHLKLAKESLLAQYKNPIEEKFREYYYRLSDDSGTDWYMDSHGKQSTFEAGAYRESAFASSGIRDLSRFCLRLAIADVMFPETKPFLLLDDTFCHSDDNKLKAISRFIEELSHEWQIVYSSCRRDSLL